MRQKPTGQTAPPSLVLEGGRLMHLTQTHTHMKEQVQQCMKSLPRPLWDPRNMTATKSGYLGLHEIPASLEAATYVAQCYHI